MTIALEIRRKSKQGPAESRVNNGGYLLFFTNTSEYASVILHALKRIGCPDAADLSRQAIDLLDIQGPLNVEKIERATNQAIPSRDEQLHALDLRYYEEVGDLSDALFGFIKAHRDRIVLMK